MKKSSMLVIALIALLIVFVTPLVRAVGATIWTDKTDYGPEETVTIFGSGFQNNADVTIVIEAPDLSMYTIHGLTDDSGAFMVQYTLDGMEGTYTVTGTDGTNTATTSFTDQFQYFTAAISPTAAYSLETKTYTITITNDLSSTFRIRSAKVTVPSGFISISIISVSAPPGRTWTATFVASEIRLAQASWDLRLEPGQSVSVAFLATAPATQGTYEWTTIAYNAYDWTSPVFRLLGTQPKVELTVSVPQYYLTVSDDIGGISGVSSSSGWYQEGTPVTLTAPEVNGYTFLNWDVDGNSQGTGVNSITVNMDAPHTATAHYFKWFTVSGVKFFDADGDEVRDTGEPGLQDWTIKLYKDSTLYDSKITDVNGHYEFIVDDPGSYEVSETLIVPWWTQTAPAPPGTYTFTAETGKNVVVDFGNWLGESIVTTSSYCWFDIDTAHGRQFKLIFVPDVPAYPTLWRLQASNPGQFMYNVFYVGTLSAGDKFTITLPYPFVTVGAMPVHVYSSLNAGPYGCLIPQNDITSQFTISGLPVTLGNGYNNFGQTTTITVTSNDKYSGFVYVAVHLDYGLKRTGAYSKGYLNEAANSKTIWEYGDYRFSVSGPGTFNDDDTVENKNVFKRDPGFGGLVTDGVGNPIQGVKVQIYGPDRKLLATVYTDEDGWYMYVYAHTGKQATYTIKLPDYGKQQSVILRAKSFVVANFQI